MSRVLISGASGFIGKALATFLRKKHEVSTYSRTNPNQDLTNFDIVIQLAGEPLIGRWTDAKKEKIRASRIDTTRALTAALSSSPPKTFICASAIGYYGDRGDEILTEKSSCGKTFLSSICSEWEAATIPLTNTRIVHTRFGIVLDPSGGALKKMLLPYKLGLGAKFGTGKQWMSWIALEDLIRALDHIIETPSLSGPINLTSPNPIRQKDFSDTLAKSLHRKALLKIPAPLVKLIFGQMGEEMFLYSDRVIPEKLLVSGFTYLNPKLADIILQS
jgi:uncharacterized protein (TIGR01777 family)